MALNKEKWKNIVEGFSNLKHYGTTETQQQKCTPQKPSKHHLFLNCQISSYKIHCAN